MDKDLLFRPRNNTVSGMPEDYVEVPGLGTLRVRGLSRAEALSLRGISDPAEAEQKILSMAMLDPALTMDEVGRWQKASDAAEIEPVTDKVTELSGMLGSSAKEAYKSLRDESGVGVRVLPSGEEVHDGKSAEAGTE